MIQIRRSEASDIDAIMECYRVARDFMRASGNRSQWTGGYPSRELVASDIAAGTSYVGLDRNGAIVMVFAFIIGDDPTYRIIEDGCWPDNGRYGTVHRLASNGKQRGVLKACVDFCFGFIDTIRLDTHAENRAMLAATEHLGFRRCGIIYCRDGSPRVAFQKSQKCKKQVKKS